MRRPHIKILKFVTDGKVAASNTDLQQAVGQALTVQIGTGQDMNIQWELKLLDSEGNNIVNVYQPYTTKAQNLMAQTSVDSAATAVTASGSG